MDKKESFIAAFYGNCDLVVRPVSEGVTMFYLDGLADEKRIAKEILAPLLEKGTSFRTESQLLSLLQFAGNVRFCKEENEGVAAVAGGDAALMTEEGYFIFSTRKSNSRAVTEPPTMSVIKGPREGFVEDVKTNMVLLRRKIRSNRLVFLSLTIGRITTTTVVIAYVHGVTPQKTVDEINKRLSEIDVDGITDSSHVAKILEKRPYSIFKQVGSSEKADVVASKLLDGRVAILVDGSPIVLTLPFLLIEDFEDMQDGYKMASLVTFTRLVRLFGAFFALFLPAAFVAVQSHQYQILPLQLMITILNATGGIPFSPTLEMVVALLLFEILTEASIRMPKHVGMALSVVGAIVLGQTAVDAGFLSSITVLIVAMSGIGVYTVPDQAGEIGFLRIFMALCAGILGIYGLLLVTLAMLAYLSEFSSFGVPYLSPFAPIEGKDLADAVVKKSFVDRYIRPFSLSTNKIRLKKRREQ